MDGNSMSQGKNQLFYLIFLIIYLSLYSFKKYKWQTQQNYMYMYIGTL